MRKLVNLLKWSATLGKEPQTFLGAKWIETFLENLSAPKKRLWALRVLSLSPHYFIEPDKPQYKNLSNEEYLEAAFRDLAASRAHIYEFILKNYLDENFTVLDYGCGPGFLAKIVAPNVRKIFACDISTGAVACARMLNGAPNLEYILADDAGMKSVADESLDAVFSFAMVQHISDEIFDAVLENCRRMLKPNGRLILHTQLNENDAWRTEDEWKRDASLQGKIKYRYGLHCFARSPQAQTEQVARHGFTDIEITPVSDLTDKKFDDICSQHLLTARKAV
jgi:cyclopropane fatty-acyl-phospholipid synthase-like methyltransferase